MRIRLFQKKACTTWMGLLQLCLLGTKTVFGVDISKVAPRIDKRLLGIIRRTPMNAAVLDTVIANAETPVVQHVAQIHLMVNGQTHDIPLTHVDVGIASTDAQIRQAVADFLEIPLGKLAAYRVERNNQTGDMTMRPEATFG